MAYFVVDAFPGGLDVRRPEWAQKAGSASVAENVHLTRGNDYEVRKAFVPQYQLPIGLTYGLAVLNEVPYVFGAGTRPPALDATFGYQQLAHPTGQPMSRILSWDVYDGKLYVAAQYADSSVHHFYDGARVTTWADGRARGQVDITAGGAGSTITSMRVNGVEILSVAVSWATSNSATAAAIAAQINAFASTPEYTSTSVGQSVFIIADAAAGAGINDAVIASTVTGTLAAQTVSNMAGGSALAGTFTPGEFVLTNDSKVYAVSGPRLHFSSVTSPTQWNPDYPGAGFTVIANHTSGAANLTALGIYLADLAIFTDKAIQIWNVEADDANNSRKQTIANYGTRSPRTVKTFGDTGLFFLDRKGVRALQPSATLANYAIVDEVGSPIDSLVIAQMAALPLTTIQRAVSIVEPVDNRWIMFLGATAYVYTYFPQARVAGWSTYAMGFTVDDAITVGNQLWARAGSTVYVYGGLTGDVYDATVPRVRLPNLNAAAPATFKDFTGFDFGLVGEWETRQQLEVDDTATELQSIASGPSFDGPDITSRSFQTAPTLEFIGRGTGYKRLVNVVLHFERNVAG